MLSTMWVSAACRDTHTSQGAVTCTFISQVGVQGTGERPTVGVQSRGSKLWRVSLPCTFSLVGSSTRRPQWF